jgi:hypothetical protein
MQKEMNRKQVNIRQRGIKVLWKIASTSI